eukprot:scaffold114283_cov18-Tisochrysis_lutea.AAC.1
MLVKLSPNTPGCDMWDHVKTINHFIVVHHLSTHDGPPCRLAVDDSLVSVSMTALPPRKGRKGNKGGMVADTGGRGSRNFWTAISLKLAIQSPDLELSDD